MKNTGEWAFEEGNKVLKSGINASSSGGFFGRLGEQSLTDHKGGDIVVGLGILLEVTLAEYRDFAIRELTPARSTEGLVKRRAVVGRAMVAASSAAGGALLKKTTARGYARMHSDRLYGQKWRTNHGLPEPGCDLDSNAHPLVRFVLVNCAT
jgi:hypothetical protein